MTNEQLNRLGMLTNIFEKCAKMGGTKPFDQIQPIVAEELHKLLNDISPKVEQKPTIEPKVEAFKTGQVKSGTSEFRPFVPEAKRRV